MSLVKLQIENEKGNFFTIARGSIESATEEALLFQARGFCMRVKDGKNIINYFADEHEESES